MVHQFATVKEGDNDRERPKSRCVVHLACVVTPVVHLLTCKTVLLRLLLVVAMHTICIPKRSHKLYNK